MTVVAARLTGDTLEMASDSRAYLGDWHRDGVVKLHHWDDVTCVGVAGTPLWDAFLDEAFLETPPERPSDVRALALAWVTWAKENGAGVDPETGMAEGSLLYAHKATLWHLCCDGAAVQVTDYVAIGSGATLAIGAMAHGATAAEAVEATLKHDAFCGGALQKYRYVQDGRPESR